MKPQKYFTMNANDGTHDGIRKIENVMKCDTVL